jgi:leucyl aminopeptidase (aminopeptidase T)
MEFETILKLVKASGVREGEMILIHFWGEDQDREIANRFAAAVAAEGASPVILQQARSANRDLFANAKAGCFDDRYFEMISGFDAVLDVFAYQPIVLGYPLEEEQMNLYRAYIARLFQALMKCKRFTQIRIPTEANAEESGLEPEDYIRRMNRAYDIDYSALSAECKREMERFSGAEKVRVRTGNGCELRMDLAGREWLADAGDGDLPCGEIYIAPVESKTNGSVFFESLWLDDVKYTGVTLEIAGGEVTGCSDAELAGKFAEMPREDRTVCEFGLGMNPNVEDLCGYTLLDEKMAGTFHIAIGMNLMFGGTNQASGHTDFVGKGTVEVTE